MKSLAAPGAFEDYDPERVRELLTAAGVLRRHPRVAYLSGYTGGQVNTVTGDFVFNCRAIYALGADGATLHRPAIFSGSTTFQLRHTNSWTRSGKYPLTTGCPPGPCGRIASSASAPLSPDTEMPTSTAVNRGNCTA